MYNGSINRFMYKGSILWDNAVAKCIYVHMVSSEGSMSCTKNQLYGNSTCTKSSCQKKYFYRGTTIYRVGT